MMTKFEPESVRVTDLMSRETLTVSQTETMHEAAEKMLAHETSAAVVVDDVGRCVGVITTHDFLNFEHQQEAARERIDGGFGFEVVAEPGEVSHIEGRAFDLVQRHMSTAVQTISQEDNVLTAARYIVAERIHHLIVLDETERPIGSLSALDVLACLMEYCDAAK